MKNKNRRRISEQGMKMIESVLRDQDAEFALENRIEDQLHFNLGEEYFRKTNNVRNNKDKDSKDYYTNSPIE